MPITDEALIAFMKAIEKHLGAVFPPAKDPMQRYAAAINIIAELEATGYQITVRSK